MFFLFNVLLLAGGVFFVKNREGKKVIENEDAPDSNIIENSISDEIRSFPVAEENNTNDNSTAPYFKSNTAPVSVSATPPDSSAKTTKKAKTKTS